MTVELPFKITSGAAELSHATNSTAVLQFAWNRLQEAMEEFSIQETAEVMPAPQHRDSFIIAAIEEHYCYIGT